MVPHFTMRTYGVNQEFDLKKAFGYIERVVKSDFYLGKYLFLHHACATRSEQPSNIKTMVLLLYLLDGPVPVAAVVILNRYITIKYPDNRGRISGQ